MDEAKELVEVKLDQSQAERPLIVLSKEELLLRVFPLGKKYLPERRIGKFLDGVERLQERYQKDTLDAEDPSSLAREFDERIRQLKNKLMTTNKGNMPRAHTRILKKWLFDHLMHPYPTEAEKFQ